MADKIVKIYDISTIGSDEVLQDLQAINKQFIDIKKNKISLNGLKAQIEDPEELKKIDKELTNLMIKEKQLATELKQKQIQMKEYQLLAAAEREEKKKQAAGNTALAGSYNEINKKYKELLALSKNSTNLLNPGEVAQAQTELKKYKDLLDNFNRGLTKDGTLVGEYTTGILQAFKSSGLDDVINDQLKKAKQNVTDLDKEFEQLKQELSDIRVSGQGNLQVIEQQLIENRNAASQFTDQINRVENELRTMNSTGSSIGNSIGLQFKNLKQDVAGFLIGYVSFQGALAASNAIKTQTIQLDSLDASLRAVSGTALEFEKNQDFLKEMTDRLGVSLLTTSQAFKNFYASSTLAGISQDETRRIFESATEAASVLKLSQDDLNGVLLAFGQIASKGTVSAEELRGQIGERIPGAFAIAAKAMGVTQSQLNDMLKDGKVLSSDFLPRFATELQKTFTLGGKEATGLAATLARVQTAITEFVQSNQEGFSKLITSISAVLVGLLTFATYITSIPFPIIITGITAITAAYVGLQVANAAATKQGLLYQALLRAKVVYDKLAAASTWLVTIATEAASSAFSTLNKVIRANPIGILLTILGLTLTAFKAFGNETSTVTKYLEKWTDKIKLLSEAQTNAQKSIQDTINKEKVYIDIATDRTFSDEQRGKALEKLIELSGGMLKGLTLENLETEKGTKLIKEYNEKLIERALLEAKIAIAKREFDKIATLQGKQIDINADFKEKGRLEISSLPEEIQNIVLKTQNNILTRNFGSVSKANIDQINKFFKEEIDKQEKRAKAAIENTGKTLANIFDDPTPKPTLGDDPKKPKKDKGPKDPKEINRIDELKKLYDGEKSVLQTNLNDKKITEEQYYSKLITLVNNYRKSKIAAIGNQNKEEMLAAKQFNEDLSKEKADALQKQLDIVQKRFDDELKIITTDKQNKEKLLDDEQSDINSSRTLTSDQKLEQELELNEKRYNLAIDYYNDIEALEVKFSLTSQENKDELTRNILAAEKAIGESRIKILENDFERFTEAQKRQYKKLQDDATRQAIDILTGSGTNDEKEALILALEKETAAKVRQLRLQQIVDELNENKELLDEKVINTELYNERVLALEDERLALLKQAADAEIQIDKNKLKEKEDLLKSFKDAGINIAEQGLDFYLRSQQQEADANFKATQEKINNDREKRLAFAQSAAEEQFIKREFEAKEKEAEKERNKEQQRLAKLKIDLDYAVALMKTYATYGFTPAAIPAAAIATAQWAFAKNLANKQKFARGGIVLPERFRNGMVTNAPNVPDQGDGDNVLGVLKAGEVILNQRQQAMLGGAKTFAAMGVPGFGSSSYYGASVQPPIFKSYFAGGAGSTGNNSEIAEMKAMIKDLTFIIEAESYKPVLLNPNAITSHQNNIAKNINLATI